MENKPQLSSSVKLQRQVQDTEIKGVAQTKVRHLISKPTDTVEKFVSNWKANFTDRMKAQANSKKRNWSYFDAVGCTSFITEGIDKLMIRYVDYIASNPLMTNDYYKYVRAYEKGKELDAYYFKHDLSKLKEYYKKVDEAKEAKKPKDADIEQPKIYVGFSNSLWRKYVLYMMLKLEGLYSTEYDVMFGISIKDNREYNPITNIASVLRPYLPFKIKEYDISQAYPTFACIDLKIAPIKDIYDRIDKKRFNTLLNTNKENKGATIQKVREALYPIFKEHTNDVITEKRFNNKGQVFRDFAKYEREYIEKFVTANSLKDYVRLHDGVVVKSNVICETLEIGEVIFKEKDISKAEVINNVVSWYYWDNEEKKYITSPSQYKNWLIQEGFIRISEKERDELTIIKNKNKILIPYNHTTDINALLAESINEANPISLENQIADDTRRIQDGFKLMEAVPYELHRDTKDEVFVPFKNGVAKITADEVVMIPYEDDSISLFAEHETQKHEFDFKLEYADNTDFKDFIINAVIGRDIADEPQLTDEEGKSLLSFLTMIGYLVSNYKDPANTHAIILSDKGATDKVRRGRRGKSLLQEAIKRMKVCIDKDGNAFDPNYTHVYADLKKRHDVYIIDDVKPNFNYNSLYSVITGSVNVEHKGKEAETIPFELAPKFLISTNWAVRYDKDASSTNARFKEYQFSDFWSIDNQPAKYFGLRFFDGWNTEQWNDFYCFMIVGVQRYLEHGLLGVEYDKDLDNFNAYFHSAAKLEEFERVFKEMDKERGFSASDFLRKHGESEVFRYKKPFHHNNLKNHLEVYAKYKKINLQRDSKKVWGVKSMVDENEAEDFLF